MATRAVLHSSNEPGELSQCLCHDDSTINVVLHIIIIIIITRSAVITRSGVVRNVSGGVGGGAANPHFLPLEIFFCMTSEDVSPTARDTDNVCSVENGVGTLTSSNQIKSNQIFV